MLFVKRKVGNILGTLLVLSVIREPSADSYYEIINFGILSALGIKLAILSWLMSNTLIIRLMGNGLS